MKTFSKLAVIFVLLLGQSSLMANDKVKALENDARRLYGIHFDQGLSVSDYHYFRFLETFLDEAREANLEKRYLPENVEITIAEQLNNVYGGESSTHFQTLVGANNHQQALNYIQNQFPLACTNDERELRIREEALLEGIRHERRWFRERDIGIRFQGQELLSRPNLYEREFQLRALINARAMVESGQITSRDIDLVRFQSDDFANPANTVFMAQGDLAAQVDTRLQEYISSYQGEPTLEGCENRYMSENVHDGAMLGEDSDFRSEVLQTCEIINERVINQFRSGTSEILDVILEQELSLETDISPREEQALMGCRGQEPEEVRERRLAAQLRRKGINFEQSGVSTENSATSR